MPRGDPSEGRRKASKYGTHLGRGCAKRKDKKATDYDGGCEVYPGAKFTEEEIAFQKAMDKFKREKDKKFPTLSEVLMVLKDLGYRKTVTPTTKSYSSKKKHTKQKASPAFSRLTVYKRA